MYQALLSMQLISQLEGKGLMTGPPPSSPQGSTGSPGTPQNIPQPSRDFLRADVTPQEDIQPMNANPASVPTGPFLLIPSSYGLSNHQRPQIGNNSKVPHCSMPHTVPLGAAPSVQPVSQGILEHEPVKVLHICVGCHLHLIRSALQGVDLLTLIQTQASGFERVQSAVVGTPSWEARSTRRPPLSQ